MQLQYNEKVLEHFRNPKNMGEMKNPDGEGTVGNPVCGDIMRLFIKVARPKINPPVGGQKSKTNKDEEIIKEIKFQTLGCGAAIATSSVLTEMAKGKTLEEAGKITNQDVAKELGGLPEIKLHCSVLAVEALRKAIEQYRNKGRGKGKEASLGKGEGEVKKQPNLWT